VAIASVELVATAAGRSAEAAGSAVLECSQLSEEAAEAILEGIV
jgi:hypothetical protein